MYKVLLFYMDLVFCVLLLQLFLHAQQDEVLARPLIQRFEAMLL